ncbi:MAG: hypothetical protein HKN47_25255 [Pirellulaceae bacterium]|nr:hypothetical protein [Pirellulaceae bacterium]
MVAISDPVAERLLQAGDAHLADMLDWNDGQQLRARLRRRAFWCTFAGWLLITSAAIVGSFVSWTFTQNVHAMFDESGLMEGTSLPFLTTVLPPTMVALTCFLIFGGLYAWSAGVFPGFSTTQRAIDWANTSDAVSRLLSVGCTYCEAFRTAARIANTRSSRDWLLNAAARVEQGGSEVADQTHASGDLAIVELLVQSSQAEPKLRWQIAKDHFFEVAQQRLALLLTTTPIFSTLAAGLIIWMSISATLGWMWSAAIKAIGGMT